jgi:haloacetate dehalogenase
VLDSVPVAEALARTDARFAVAWWYWFFFAQPDKPERAVLADPAAWYGAHAPGKVAALGRRTTPTTLRRSTTRTRSGQCWRTTAPVCASTVRPTRPDWTTDLRGGGPIDSGHHMAEDAAEQLTAEPGRFLAM